MYVFLFKHRIIFSIADRIRIEIYFIQRIIILLLPIMFITSTLVLALLSYFSFVFKVRQVLNVENIYMIKYNLIPHACCY